MSELLNETNNKNQLSVTLLKNDIDKLTIFFIKRIIENSDRLDLTKHKGQVGTSYRYLKEHTFYVRMFLRLNNYLAGNTAILLLPKLLFKDLSILNDFYKWGFVSVICETHLTNCNTKEDVEKYLRLVKINLVNYCKILLKEFDLTKFCRQCMKIGNIKLNYNFPYHKSRLSAVEKKVKKIDSLLRNIYYTLESYDYALFTLYNYAVDDKLTLLIENLSPIFYYITFYYRAKLVKSLLKQYKEVVENNELKKNINMRLFTHFSIILIFMCLKLAISKVEKFICGYFFNSSFIRQKSIENLEKILNKTVEILEEFYSVIFKEYVSSLLATRTGYPLIDRDIYWELYSINTNTINIRKKLRDHFTILEKKFVIAESFEKSLQANRILSAAEKICSIVSLIIQKFKAMAEASRC